MFCARRSHRVAGRGASDTNLRQFFTFAIAFTILLDAILAGLVSASGVAIAQQNYFSPGGDDASKDPMARPRRPVFHLLSGVGSA